MAMMLDDWSGLLDFSQYTHRPVTAFQALKLLDESMLPAIEKCICDTSMVHKTSAMGPTELLISTLSGLTHITSTGTMIDHDANKPSTGTTLTLEATDADSVTWSGEVEMILDGKQGRIVDYHPTLPVADTSLTSKDWQNRISTQAQTVMNSGAEVWDSSLVESLDHLWVGPANRSSGKFDGSSVSVEVSRNPLTVSSNSTIKIAATAKVCSDTSVVKMTFAQLADRFICGPRMGDVYSLGGAPIGTVISVDPLAQTATVKIGPTFPEPDATYSTALSDDGEYNDEPVPTDIRVPDSFRVSDYLCVAMQLPDGSTETDAELWTTEAGVRERARQIMFARPDVMSCQTITVWKRG